MSRNPKGRPRWREGLSGSAVRRIEKLVLEAEKDWKRPVRHFEALVITAGNDWKRPVHREWVDPDLAEAGTQ